MALDEDDAPLDDGLTLLGGAVVRLFEPELGELVVVVVLGEPAEEPEGLEWWCPCPCPASGSTYWEFPAEPP